MSQIIEHSGTAQPKTFDKPTVYGAVGFFILVLLNLGVMTMQERRSDRAVQRWHTMIQKQDSTLYILRHR